MAIKNDSKPYILEKPAEIAQEYGGNKQKIAAAAQRGIIDPTAAVLAGMFIDQMRTAAAQEQVPNQTVAQQVFAPPAPQTPPAGLGATAPAQQMAMAAPPMQPPATPLAQPPAPMPAPGMADGGLASLPVPDSLYDDSYAGGGVVAFSDGGDVPRFSAAGPVASFNDLGSMIRTQQAMDPFYSGFGGNLSLEDMIAAAQQRRAIPLSEGEQAYLDRLKGAPERAKKLKSETFNQFLAETGLRMLGSRAPGLLAAAGESATAAVPRLFTGAKEARELEEASIKGMADIGRAERAQQLAGITAGEQMFGRQQELGSRADIAQLDRENRMAIAMIPDKAVQVAEQLRKNNPGMSYLESITQASQALTPRDTYNATRNAVSAAAKDASAQFTTRLTFDPKLQEDVKKAAAGDADAKKRVEDIRNAIERDVFRLYQVEGVDLSSGRMGTPKANDPLGIRG